MEDTPITEAEQYQPQLIEEAEMLLGTPFFLDGGLYDPEIATQQELGLKKFIYRACCRVFATDRMDERAQSAGEPGYEARTWNNDWELTTRKIAQIAFANESNVSFWSRQLAIANSAEQYIGEHWEEIKSSLYPDQQLYVLDLIASLQKPARTVAYHDNLSQSQYADVLGCIAVSPTGSGKTHIIKACLPILSAGKPLEHSKYGERPVRILLVVPSLLILEQTVKMLRAGLPDLIIGSMCKDEQRPTADVVVSTIEMFNNNVQDGHIAGQPVDILMIDEVHQLSEPIFRKTFLEQWHGLTLGFTATPAYDLKRDARKIIPDSVEHNDIATLIEKDRLNDGQIFTFFIDSFAYSLLLRHYGLELPEAIDPDEVRKVIDTLVIEFTIPLLEEGRRGIIFCEQGDQARFARQLAERFRLIKLSDDTHVTAEAMESYANNQNTVMQAFRSGKLQVVTTVDTGRQGLDAEFDFVIINTNIISPLRGHQIVGRGTRKSDRFPVTVYAQFARRLGTRGEQFERQYSIEETFGGNAGLKPGRALGSREKRQYMTPRGTIELSKFPNIIAELLVRTEGTPIGESFAGVNRGAWAIGEGMIALREIIEGYNTNEATAKRALRRAGFAWRARYERTDDITRLAYYYPEAAKEFLQGILPKSNILSREQVATHFGVSVSTINHVIDNPANNITGRTVVRPSTKGPTPVGYDDTELAKIKIALKQLPGIQPGDSTAKAVAAELGINEATVLRLAGVQKGEKRFLIGHAFPLTAAENARARAAFDSTPPAEPGEMHLTLIAETAGVDYQFADRNMTPKEKASTTEKRIKDKRGFTRFVPVWPADISREIVERMKKIKTRKLDAHLLPASALRKLVRNYSVTSAEKIAVTLASGGFEAEKFVIFGNRAMSQSLSWAAIAYLQKTMGKSKGNTGIEIDFSRLPSGPDDLDPGKIAYAQQIQLQFLRQEQLREY